MGQIKKAVILAAGLGSRLKPLTDEIPKCLTEVHGQTITEHTLDILEKYGIKETVLVVGYLGEIVRDRIGRQYRDMRISYIENNIYDETNSMYSAWLAKDILKEGALLIEGDTFFDDKLIGEILKRDDGKSYWIADQFRRGYEGSMSITDSEKRIVDIRIVRAQLAAYEENYYKSTGILKITSEYGKILASWLDDEVRGGNVNIYYDLVVAKHLKDYPIYVHDVTGLKWAELDSLDDVIRVEKIFTPRKYVIIIIDGAADLPQPELGDRTPLEAARIPNMDFLAGKGKTGLMRTMYPGLPVGSIVANLGILGYNPLRYYPNGRASFEALAQDIFMDEGDIAFRCNLVSVTNGILSDFTAKNINHKKAKTIIDSINEHCCKDLEIYPSQGYRNILIVRCIYVNASDVIALEPHMNLGKPVKELLLKGRTPKAKKLAGRLNSFILESPRWIKSISKKLKTRADMLFLWSPSIEPRLPSFHSKYGIDGAVIAGLDFMHGIASAARLEAKKIPGATGDSDTDLDAKLRYALNAIKHNDLVYIHINASDEESHRNDIKGKISSIERIDKKIVGPITKHLQKAYPKYRISILPDHYTLAKDGKHADNLVPYLIYGDEIKKGDVKRFCEKCVSEKSRSIIKNYEFMDFLLRG